MNQPASSTSTLEVPGRWADRRLHVCRSQRNLPHFKLNCRQCFDWATGLKHMDIYCKSGSIPGVVLLLTFPASYTDAILFSGDWGWNLFPDLPGAPTRRSSLSRAFLRPTCSLLRAFPSPACWLTTGSGRCSGACARGCFFRQELATRPWNQPLAAAAEGQRFPGPARPQPARSFHKPQVHAAQAGSAARFPDGSDLRSFSGH